MELTGYVLLVLLAGVLLFLRYQIFGPLVHFSPRPHVVKWSERRGPFEQCGTLNWGFTAGTLVYHQQWCTHEGCTKTLIEFRGGGTQQHRTSPYRTPTLTGKDVNQV